MAFCSWLSPEESTHLLASSTNGVHTISLAQPLFCYVPSRSWTGFKVQRWIDEIRPFQHEFIAEFLFFHTLFPALAIGLSGLSLETKIKFRDQNSMEVY